MSNQPAARRRRRDARDGGEPRREREHEPVALRPRDEGLRPPGGRRAAAAAVRYEGESGSGRRPRGSGGRVKGE